jgi:hypothetical protein
MRRRKLVVYTAPGLRGEVAARIHEVYGDIWRRPHGGTGEPPASWVGRAARIEAGEAVRVASWELPSSNPAHSGTHWYTLEPDGSLTERE